MEANMSLKEKLWSYIKGLRPVRKYATDAKGKEIRFPIKLNRHAASTKDGSRPGHRHVVNPCARPTRGDGLTNNERVITGRAARMGISFKEYKRRYPKGA
jgi:hypothetical protein